MAKTLDSQHSASSGEVRPRDKDTRLSADVERFLGELEALPEAKAGPQPGRVLFTLDATMSRAPTWRAARQVQGDMFAQADSLGGLDVQVAFFRGQHELRRSGWVGSGAALADKMARVTCRAGLTQIARLLKLADREARDERLDAMIYIGDAVEENPDQLAGLAAKLALRSVPVFAFQEGRDPKVEAIFRDLARITGGAYARFDAASAATLRALLRAVGAYAGGGLAALDQLASTDAAAASLHKQIAHGPGA